MSSLGVLIYIEKMNIKTSPRLARVEKKSNHSLGQGRLYRKKPLQLKMSSQSICRNNLPWERVSRQKSFGGLAHPNS